MNLKEFMRIQSYDLKSELIFDFEYLVIDILKITKLDLYTGQKDINSDQIQELSIKIQDLKNGKPLAYILNSQEFMGLNFFVDHRVLIPRPETEYMVDLCLKDLKSDVGLILDAGAGSGCIGISILSHKPNFKCIFLEKSTDAIEVLKINLKKQNINPKSYDIISHFEDCTHNLKLTNNSLDLFISNPPYIEFKDERLDDSVLNYEPEMALFAEDRGLRYLKEWSLKAMQYLKFESGFAIFEFGLGQENALQSFAKLKTIDSIIINDQYGKPRFWKINN